MTSKKKMFILNYLPLLEQYHNAKAEQVKWDLKVATFRNS